MMTNEQSTMVYFDNCRHRHRAISPLPRSFNPSGCTAKRARRCGGCDPEMIAKERERDV